MSQHDFNIANQGFPATRSDINNALAALASTSSGASEPSTTYANQFWYDTTNNLLKFRNEADSAWITLAYLDQATNEWEIRSAVIQAVDSAGISLRTDDGTTRVVIQDDGDVAFDTDTLFVDAVNDRVGVGTSAPSNIFEVNKGSAGTLALFTDGVNSTFEIETTSLKTTVGNSAGSTALALKSSDAERLRIEADGYTVVRNNMRIGEADTVTTFQGLTIRNAKDSSAALTTSFVDAQNDEGTADAHMFFDHLTDGSSEIIWGTTPAGSRTSDRRVEAMRITGDQFLCVGRSSSQNANTFASFEHDVYNENVIWSHNTSASFQNTVNVVSSARTQNSAYKFLEGLSGWSGSTDVEFVIRGDGQGYIDGSWNGGGADYAEYFEWSDGNTSNEDRVGYTVVLDGDKIRKATSSDDASNIIGAVSGNPSVIGDTDLEAWKYKYLRDDFGRYIRDTHNVVEWTETVVDEPEIAEVLDDYGNVATPAQPARTRDIKHSYEDWNIPDNITVPDDATTSAQDENGNAYTHRRLNPNYDPDMAYISREDRQEWATIGMMGKLRIRVGQPVGDRWIKMRDVSDTVEEWLVR